MRRKREFDSNCGTLLILAAHFGSTAYLNLIRMGPSALDWDLVDRWLASDSGYLVVHMGVDGGNLFELVAKDTDDLLGRVLESAAARADDVSITLAGGIAQREVLEDLNERWVALGGLSNPDFDCTLAIH